MRYKDALELTGTRKRALALRKHGKAWAASVAKMPQQTVEECIAQYDRLKAESRRRRSAKTP